MSALDLADGASVMSSSPPALRFEDYEAIADAVAETERGRWFLNEYARRNRAADTAVVLEALAAIEARFATFEPRRIDGAIQDSPEDALALVRSAGGIAVRLRAELEESPQDELARALCLELVEMLGDALERMSGPRRETAIAPQPQPGLVEGASAGLDFDWTKPLEDEPAFELGEPKTSEEAAPNQGLNSFAGDLAAFDAPAEAVSGPVAETETAPDPARQDETASTARRRRPAVWSPGMLDRLSAAERTILFG